MKMLKSRGKLILFILLVGFCIYSAFLYLTKGQVGHDTVLVDLASRFIERKISLSIYNLPPRDIANYYNNYYVYFGPLASLLLMPFVFIFGKTFPQVSIGVFSMIVSFFAAYKICKKNEFSSIDSLFLALFFVFSTVLFSSSVINITAYQVEALGVPFILLAILAYFSKKNSFLIGIFLGLAIMTRFTLVLALGFFFLEVIQKRFTMKHFIILMIPIIISLSILGMYNSRRFHSIFETGYNYSISIRDLPIGFNLKYGDISLVHIPANIYSFFVMSPEPYLTDNKGGMVLQFPYLKANPWGIAIWYTSPLFLLLIFKFKKGKYTLSAVIATFLLAIPVFTWYSVGYAQYGYRYALDFLPFLFLLLLPCLKPRLSPYALLLIAAGVAFNCIYIDSIWEIYPIFNIYK